MDYKEGKTPSQIFSEQGFDLDMIGKEQPKQCLKRWRNTYEKFGEEGLLTERRGKGSTGRLSSKEFSAEEKLRKAEARINNKTILTHERIVIVNFSTFK